MCDHPHCRSLKSGTGSISGPRAHGQGLSAQSEWIWLLCAMRTGSLSSCLVDCVSHSSVNQSLYCCRNPRPSWWAWRFSRALVASLLSLLLQSHLCPCVSVFRGPGFSSALLDKSRISSKKFLLLVTSVFQCSYENTTFIFLWIGLFGFLSCFWGRKVLGWPKCLFGFPQRTFWPTQYLHMFVYSLELEATLPVQKLPSRKCLLGLCPVPTS